MDPRFTAGLAVWGALVSTVALCWQIFAWLRSYPRIAVKAEMVEGFSSEADDFIRFELRNRGHQATTVEGVMFVEHRSWWSKITRVPDHIENIWVGHEQTMKLPAVLQPNEVWKGTCPFEGRYEHSSFNRLGRRERFQQGRLFYRIRCAHTDRLLRGTVKPESSFERM